jgi:hypothetical protein
MQLEELKNFIQQRMQKSHEKAAARYNLRAREKNYQVGQVVWRKNFRISDATKQYSAKLGNRNIKCRIVERVGSNTYRLKDVDSGKDLGVFSSKE